MLTPIPTPPPVKLAIFRSTSIGDVVLATVCIDLLSKLSATVELIWIGRSPALPLLAAAFPALKTFEVDTDDPNYTRDLIEAVKHVHMVVDLQMSLRSRSLCRTLHKTYNIPIYNLRKNSLKRGQMVVSARLRGRRTPLPESYRRPEYLQYEAMKETLLRALEIHLPVDIFDSVKHAEAYPRLDTKHEEGQRTWQKELKFGRWLALAPGASYEAKRAPEELFIEVLNHLNYLLQDCDAQQLGLLFVGNEEDRVRALSIANQIQWSSPVLNLAGKLSLWESALAIRETRLILSNDSSLCHIGEAVGVPSAVLFGPTVEAFGFPPWRKESLAFSSPLGCRPCSKHGKVDCRYGDKLCFKLLPARVIAKQIFEKLCQPIPS